MVNLPSSSQERNHHTWNYRRRVNRRINQDDPEPKTLLQLEALADRCADLMNKYEESPHHRETSMKLLRQQYNLVSLYYEYYYGVELAN